MKEDAKNLKKSNFEDQLNFRQKKVTAESQIETFREFQSREIPEREISVQYHADKGVLDYDE